MLIGYPDGSTVGVCSVHCAAADLEAHPGLEAESLLVADRNTRSLIDARKAFWVWGGKKRGVMTQVPKWAFGQQAAALAFIEENGGTSATWEEVLKASREEIARGE